MDTMSVALIFQITYLDKDQVLAKYKRDIATMRRKR